MKLCDYKNFGHYDSKIRHANLKITEKRIIESFEFDLLTYGDGISYIDNDSHPLSDGLLIFRKPGQVSNSLLGFKSFYVYLDFDKNSEYYDMLLNFPNYYAFIDKRKYFNLFSHLISLFSKYGTDKENDLINAEILKLLYYMNEDKEFNASVSKNRDKSMDKIRLALDFMDENYCEKILLKDIADAINYSPYYFQRKFTEIMKISPNDYVNNLRIDQAKKLLINSNMSVAEISYACGFPSQSYFCFLFKKQLQVTPSDFRKSVSNSYLI